MDTKEQLQGFATRLNEICDDMGVPPKGKNRQATVAKIFKVSQKGARKWLEGEGMPTLVRCADIASWAGCHTEWLISGRGPKRSDSLAADQYSDQMNVAMQRLPEYLKPIAIRQVTALGSLGKKSDKDPHA